MSLRLIRFRRVLRSRPFLLVLTALALWGTTSVLQSAEAARTAWGQRVTVFRAARDLSPGTLIKRTDLDTVELPRASVGADATASSNASALVGQRVVSPIQRGDTILVPRTRASVSAIAARIAAGHRGVSVPTDERLPSLRVGDRVSVVDPTQPKMKPIDAVVVDVGSETVTVEALETDAVVIANAALRNSVAILLRGA
jgi:Flp pilus assembly protein CpaB